MFIETLSIYQNNHILWNSISLIVIDDALSLNPSFLLISSRRFSSMRLQRTERNEAFPREIKTFEIVSFDASSLNPEVESTVQTTELREVSKGPVSSNAATYTMRITT